ncbi:MAG: hypothetical protein IJV04_04015, partial [Lachnospiraceae bacterium]|nr:hypothetical protein [Lachnospiraceae bacterium]
MKSFTAALQAAGSSGQDPFSSAHLFSAAALHLVFVLAALSALAAAAERFGASPAVAVAAVFAVPWLRSAFCDPAACGLADLPVAGATIGALLLAADPAAEAGAGGDARRGFWHAAALAAAFFG